MNLNIFDAGLSTTVASGFVFLRTKSLKIYKTLSSPAASEAVHSLSRHSPPARRNRVRDAGLEPATFPV